MSSPESSFKSLFLPLRPNDRAVFASVCTLLTLGSEPPAGAGAEASAHHQQPGTARSSTATFSAAEGGGNFMEESGAAWAPPPPPRPAANSALFALLSGRGDGAVTVLATREVVFFNLTNPRRGPFEVQRFAPLPATGARASTTLSKTNEAVCAALLPMELSYLCRVDSRQRPGDSGAAPVYMRGLVGCRDGRVHVFAESGYVFSFAAHDCPVVAVHAVYSAREPEDQQQQQQRATASSAATSVAPVMAGFASVAAGPEPLSMRRAMRYLGIVTTGKDGTVLVWRQQQSNGAMCPRQLTGASSLHRSVALCVFQPTAPDLLVTILGGCGGVPGGSRTDTRSGAGVGPVSRWAADTAAAAAASGNVPNTLQLAAFVPVITDADASASARARQSSQQQHQQSTGDVSREVLPTPQALFALPGVYRAIRSQCLAPRAMAAEADHGIARALSTADVHDYTLPNVGLFSTRAIATDGETCVLAYSNKLQAFPLGYLKPLNEDGDNILESVADRVKQPVFVAKKKITHVELKGGLCAAACGNNGLLYLLQLPAFVLLGEYRSFDSRPIATISLYPAARLVAVVDGLCGSVEMVQVQQSAMDIAKAASAAATTGAAKAQATYAAMPIAAKSLSTAVALRYECELEGIVGEIARQSALRADATQRLVIARQDEMRACQEALLLSSLAVPTACDEFLPRHTTVL